MVLSAKPVSAIEKFAFVMSYRCQPPPAPDVLVLDVHMPGASGAELLRRARAHAPCLPAIVVTGYPADDSEVRSVMSDPRCAYLAKPVDITALSDLVARLTSSDT